MVSNYPINILAGGGWTTQISIRVSPELKYTAEVEGLETSVIF